MAWGGGSFSYYFLENLVLKFGDRMGVTMFLARSQLSGCQHLMCYRDYPYLQMRELVMKVTTMSMVDYGITLVQQKPL